MVTVSSYYFHRLNRQPGADVRAINALASGVVCLQDTVHAAELINDTCGAEYSVRTDGDNTTLIRRWIEISEQHSYGPYNLSSNDSEPIQVTKIVVDEQEYTIINVKSIDVRGRRAVRKDYKNLKQVIKLHGSKNTVVCGNLSGLREASSWLTGQDYYSKVLSKFEYSQNNTYGFIAWSKNLTAVNQSITTLASPHSLISVSFEVKS